MALPQMAWISQCAIVHIHNCCAARSNSSRGCSDCGGCSTVSWARTGQGEFAAEDTELYSDPDSALIDRDPSESGACGGIRVAWFPGKGGADLSVPIEAEAGRLCDYRNIGRGYCRFDMDLPPLQGPCVLICEGSLEFWDAPWGGREKDNKKRIVNNREEITGKRKIFWDRRDRKSTRLNSSHGYISYAVFCLK